MSRVLFTEGRFVGRQLVETLVAKHEVVMVSRRPTAVAGVRQVLAVTSLSRTWHNTLTLENKSGHAPRTSSGVPHA
jgi:hypothetical protein